jgi:hypothetical protein
MFFIVAILLAIEERGLHFDIHVSSRPILIIFLQVRQHFTVCSFLLFSDQNSAALHVYHTSRLMRAFFYLVVPKCIR